MMFGFLFRKKHNSHQAETTTPCQKSRRKLTKEDYEIIHIAREATGIWNYSDAYFYEHFL